MTVALGLQNEVFARVHTFGKALGCHGAAVMGSKDLKSYLVNFARSFIYTTALPPREALRINRSLEKLRHTEQREKLRQNIEMFRNEMNALNLGAYFIPSHSPIQSFLLPDKAKADEIRKRLDEEKMGAKIIFSPTVPKGQERIRICIHSFNTSDQIRTILQLLSTFV